MGPKATTIAPGHGAGPLTRLGPNRGGMLTATVRRSMQTDELLARCRTAFEMAARRAPVTDRRLRIGGRPVLLRAVGAVADRLAPPMTHLEDPGGTGPPELVIHAWASDGAEALLGADPGAGPLAAEEARYADLRHERCAMAWPDEGLVEGFVRQPDGPGSPDEAWWWVPEIAKVPLAELAMPFRPIIHWWSESIGLQMVHAACVGTPEQGGVLLGGVSGSGKSTTALWALTSPDLVFLGDDYVLVDPDRSGSPEAYSLYTTAKIHEPDQHRVPHITAEVVGRQQRDKLIAFLQEPFGDRIVEHLPVRAILLPRVGGGGPAIAPIGAAAALRRLGPSTVLQFPGADPGRVLAVLARLVRSTPAFDFALGPDPAATPAAIEGFLASGAGTG